MPINLLINSKTSGRFTRELIDGRSHIVTRMMPIRGDITMNAIYYPDAEVAASYEQLNMLPAPNGHPTVNGVAVPAFHPVANNKHNIGAFLRNPRKKGKCVFADLMIDEQVANNSEEGKELIRRIESNERVGVSTGLGIAQVQNKVGKDDFGKEYTLVGSGYQFDHVAVLLNEEAAGAHAGTELVHNAEWRQEDADIDELNESLVKLTNSISENSQIVLNGDKLSIVDNAQQSETKTEETQMEKSKLALAIIGNKANTYAVADNDKLMAMSDDELLSIVGNSEMTIDQAKEIVTNSGVDLEGYKTFAENKAEFEAWHGEQVKAHKAKIENIVANSEYTSEMLQDKPDAELDLITNMIKPVKTADRAPQGTGPEMQTNSEQSVRCDYS